jgi:phytanoyl-CoA hydroxylase
MTIPSEKQDAIREIAKRTLESLRLEASSNLTDAAAPAFWVQNNTTTIIGSVDATTTTTATVHSTQDCRFFNYTGFLHIPQFVDSQTCERMKREMHAIVQSEWDPEHERIDTFGTNNASNEKRGDYFLESSNRVHFFTEPVALQEDGVSLKEEYLRDPTTKISALNKVGHALHLRPGSTFHEYCMSSRIRTLVTDLGWQDPVVPQSMYIFKQAHTGGAVTSHQDSSFLFTTPRQTCLGLWLALDDATLTNGCLWVRPRSHQEPVRRQYKRNVQHFGETAIKTRSNHARGDTLQPKLIMENIPTQMNHTVPWEGTMPPNGVQGLLDSDFIPIECKAGDLVLFCGTLDHLSLSNSSNQPRHTFQLHLVEGFRAGVHWSEYNWLQYPENRPFLRLLGD